MRASAVLILVAACEMEVTPKPVHVEHAAPVIPPGDSAPSGSLEIVVQDYGTDAPIAGATIDLIVYSNCNPDRDGPCPAPERKTLQSNDRGFALVETPPKWSVENISASGYMTNCPSIDNDDWHHRLVAVIPDMSNDLSQYHCHLVPPAALVVRDRKAAQAIARRDPETAQWLRHHSAQPPRVELDGIRWHVTFATADGSDAIFVIVDALDSRAYVDTMMDGGMPSDRALDQRSNAGRLDQNWNPNFP